MKMFSRTDRLIDQLDQTLRAVFLRSPADPYPETVPRVESELTLADRTLAARLMRVNHAGEVAAQALYQGHALCATKASVQEAMRRAGREEYTHLQWTQARIRELRGRRSLLTPLWYAGSFAIGAATSFAGDAVGLGFVAETERQVVAHLQGHLARLPPNDQKTRVILEHMITDESRHATEAIEAGGRVLSQPARFGMRLVAGLMTRIAFWV